MYQIIKIPRKSYLGYLIKTNRVQIAAERVGTLGITHNAMKLI